MLFVAELNALLHVVSRDDAYLIKTLIPVAKFLERKVALEPPGLGSSDSFGSADALCLDAKPW